ncbi:EpsG family protein [Sphingomonas faeni]
MERADVPRLGRVMLIYWLMFGFPSSMALIERDRARRFGFAWGFALIATIALIGFRWQTGGDWSNYDRMVEQATWNPVDLSPLGDPGFALLLSFAARSHIGLLLVTAASGLVMGIALTRFCRDQPRPWLCMAVAVPYLVVVMGMGYIRQGMAISFLLMGLMTLRRGHVLRYSAWVVVGALFHSTAFILLPLGVMAVNRNVAVRVGLAVLGLAMLGYAIVSAHGGYVANYIDSAMTSSGAAVRLFMTALPAAIFLGFRDRFAVEGAERSVWTALSLAAIAAFALLFAFRSSTVVDRLGLYLIPVQCFVYARMPAAFARDANGERLLTVAILLLYAAAFFIWLNYAVNVDYWLPYRFYFFEDGLCLAC